jgi:membrane protein DedA with SNARE-associated domain
LKIEALLMQHGLLAVLLLATIEGDLTLILAGVLAHLGYFDMGAAILAGTAGNFIGDTVWYTLGRMHAERLRNTRVYRRVGPTIERFSRRLGVWELLVARAVYGTRNASMLFWGLNSLPFLRFAVVDGLGCVGWSAIFATLGYALSGSAEALIGHVKRIELFLLFALIAAGLAVFLLTRLIKRELEQGDGER